MSDWYDAICPVCRRPFEARPIDRGGPAPYRRSLCHVCEFQWWEDAARVLDPAVPAGLVMLSNYCDVVEPLYGRS